MARLSPLGALSPSTSLLSPSYAARMPRHSSSPPPAHRSAYRRSPPPHQAGAGGGSSSRAYTAEDRERERERDRARYDERSASASHGGSRGGDRGYGGRGAGGGEQRRSRSRSPAAGGRREGVSELPSAHAMSATPSAPPPGLSVHRQLTPPPRLCADAQGGPVLEDRPPPPKAVEPNFEASGSVPSRLSSPSPALRL